MRRAIAPALLAMLLAGGASADVQRTARGTSGAFEVASGTPLRAKALRDAASPVLVRVNEIAPERYRIEYIGTVEGAFDLVYLGTSSRNISMRRRVRVGDWWVHEAVGTVCNTTSVPVTRRGRRRQCNHSLCRAS